jgi:hypothetical protein
MTVFTMLVFLAALATLVALASGVAAMASHGEIAHRTSEQWMIWRVVFQGAALLIVLAAIAGS